jgi:SNF2 family DNA or RNA helicase
MTKPHNPGSESPLFPDLDVRDAASILCSSSSKLARDIIKQFGDPIKKEFANAPKWTNCTGFTKRFSAVVVDEAHLLRNSHSVTTRSVLALTRNCHYRFILTGTPFNNKIDDVSTLSWLLADAGAWSRPAWWKELPISTDHISQEACQNKLALWRESVLMRGKDVLAAHLPDRAEVVVSVSPSEPEQLYGATLYVKLQASIKDYELAQNTGNNRFLAFQKVLSCLMRLMQSTTHALIVAGRGYTQQFSKLSKSKTKSFCVNCKGQEDTIALDSDLLRNEQDEDEADVLPRRKVRATKHDYSLDEFVVDSDDGSAESEDVAGETFSDDDAGMVLAADADDDDAPIITHKMLGTSLKPEKLPCGHHLCSTCLSASMAAGSKSAVCYFCRDMEEINCKMSPEDIPKSSKLQALVEELMTLPQ